MGTAVVLDGQGMGFIDAQGAATLRELVDRAEQSGVELRFARIKPGVREVLERDGLLARLEGRIYDSVGQAVAGQG